MAKRERHLCIVDVMKLTIRWIVGRSDRVAVNDSVDPVADTDLGASGSYG